MDNLKSKLVGVPSSDNLKSKLLGMPSSDNLFESNIKNNASKIFYKNISKKIITNERITKENIINNDSSIHVNNEFFKKSNNPKFNTNDYALINSLNKSKIVAKISKGGISGQNYKN